VSNKEERSIKELWTVFDRGDILTDVELKRLMKNAQAGLTYLDPEAEEREAALAKLTDREKELLGVN